MILVGRAEGGLPFLNTQFLLSNLCSVSQLQSIIKKVIAHFHDFSVLFSVVSSISYDLLRRVSSVALMFSCYPGQEYLVDFVKEALSI